MASLNLIFDNRTEERALVDRVNRLKSRITPMNLKPSVRAIQSIQFLRGVSSLATTILPAFYLFLGANVSDKDCILDGYQEVVFRHSIKSSSVDTIALSCRKIFDHSNCTMETLTSKAFTPNSDDPLESVAKYWSENSNRSFEEALTALLLLQSIFKDCAKQKNAISNTSSLLSKRILLFKQCAGCSSAHLSMQSYEFSIKDCAHVAAAITVIGAIIRSFDDPYSQPSYFDALDEASLVAAKYLFPAIPDIRLFQHLTIESLSRLYLEEGIDAGRRLVLDQLPYAIGWF